MTRSPGSLRGRLALSMLLVVAATLSASLGGPALLRRAAALLPDLPAGPRGELAALLPYGAVLAREPYQDLAMMLPFGAAALLLVWLVSGWSLRPLRRAAREAAAAGPANLDGRISTALLPSEIRPLAEAVNGALDRLAGAYAVEQRFTADAAHALRTPLTVLSLRLQQARQSGRPDWAAIERELGQVTHLAGQLLDLARKERAGAAGGATCLAEVSLSRVAREAAADILPLVERAGRSLRVDLVGTLAVRGRADDLRDMVRTLLENALVHGEGTIRLSGRAGPPAAARTVPPGAGRTVPPGAGRAGPPAAGRAGPPGGVVLSVADEGPGVAPTLREQVFERFRKGRAASPGAGLGLAIVREVARTHGASVAFAPGAACVVLVTWPPAPDAAEVAPPEARGDLGQGPRPAARVAEDVHGGTERGRRQAGEGWVPPGPVPCLKAGPNRSWTGLA